MGCGFQDVDYIVSFRLTWGTVRTCLKITKATIKREVEKFIKFPEISKDNKITISCTPKLSRCFISWRQRNGLLFIKLYGAQLICSCFICSRCLQSQRPRSFLLPLFTGLRKLCLPWTEKLTVFSLGSSASGQLGNKPTLNSHSQISVNQLFNKGLPQQAPVLHSCALPSSEGHEEPREFPDSKGSNHYIPFTAPRIFYPSSRTFLIRAFTW